MPPVAQDELTAALTAGLRKYDAATALHSTRVGRGAVALARALRLGRDDLETLRVAGALHDIGKLGIGGLILNKPERLTPAEWALVVRHPTVGANMLLDISPKLFTLSSTIRSHHERWEGSGYPGGLSGDRIPLFARIIAVADAIDSMSSVRAHRRTAPLSTEQITAELRRCSATQFDPEIAAAAIGLVEQGKLF
jgi:HD-GYP domain-containing protein (c-di-GMP phosphodiesterase class II)